MKRLVIVGNAWRAQPLDQILKHRHDFETTIFGDETESSASRVYRGMFPKRKESGPVLLRRQRRIVE